MVLCITWAESLIFKIFLLKFNNKVDKQESSTRRNRSFVVDVVLTKQIPLLVITGPFPFLRCVKDLQIEVLRAGWRQTFWRDVYCFAFIQVSWVDFLLNWLHKNIGNLNILNFCDNLAIFFSGHVTKYCHLWLPFDNRALRVASIVEQSSSLNQVLITGLSEVNIIEQPGSKWRHLLANLALKPFTDNLAIAPLWLRRMLRYLRSHWLSWWPVCNL